MAEEQRLPNPGSAVLYKAATGLERAMADADCERILATDAEQIISVWDPYKIASHNLPYLAWAMGVLLWEQEWEDHTKREWTARQWEWKAIRGTEAGIDMALDFMGRDFVGTGGYELVQALVPPAGFYAAPNLSKNELDEWIRLMPQIRIKFSVATGNGSEEFFVAPPEPDDLVDGQEGTEPAPIFSDDNVGGRDDGWALYGRKAVLRRADGTETPLKLVEWSEDDSLRPAVIFGEASEPGLSTIGAYFAGEDAVGEDRFTCFEDVPPRTYSYRLDTAYEHSASDLHLDYLRPDLEPIDVRYERNSDIGTKGPFLFVNDFVGDPDESFVDLGNDAWEMLADRIYLNDPAISAPMNAGISFAGVDRVSVPAYHADLLIDLKTKDRIDSWFAEDSIVNSQSAAPEDLEDFDRALRAVVAAKAFRDKIAVSFETTIPLRFRDPIFETTTFGTQVRNIL
jgi:phage tail P2-like protein